MSPLPIVEVVAGIIALLYAGAAFINLTWAEGASSESMKRASAVKTKRLFLLAAIFGIICVVCAYLAMHPPQSAGHGDRSSETNIEAR